jgi:hypothetical protein
MDEEKNKGGKIWNTNAANLDTWREFMGVFSMFVL